MNGINEVLLFGTVGSDPETKILNENSRVSTFRLATSETYTDKNGEKKEVTEWHNIEAWGYLSNTISSYLKKGNHVILKGKLKTDSYDDINSPGKKIYRAKVVVNQINLLPKQYSRNEQGTDQQNQTPNYQQPAQQQFQQQFQQPVQQPIQQPIQQQFQQPAQQPAQQPVQQPVQQFQQPVTQFMSDEQFEAQIAPDDLPF